MLHNSLPSSPIITKKTTKSDGDFTQPPSRSRVRTIKVNTVLTKAGKRAGTPFPYQFKTPLRLPQRIHPLTSVKSSPVKVNEKTFLSEGHKDLKDLKVEQTEVKVKVDPLGINAENVDTEERKYVKILTSSCVASVQKKSDESEKNPSQATVVMSNQVKQKIWFNNQGSGEEDNDEGYVTPYILAQETKDFGSEKEIDTKEIEIMKGKRRFFDKTPMYLPNKKVKKNQEFFQDSVRLYDKSRKEHIRFRLFKDKDLGNNRYIQTTLKESKIDDDCPTDSEQMELAKKHIIKQLKQSMECQTPRNTPESLPRLSSSIGSRLDSSKFMMSQNLSEIGSTSSFYIRSHDDDFTIDFKNFSQQEKKRVVKRLSYDDDNSLMMMLNSQEGGFISEPESGSEKSKEIIYFDMLN